MSLFVFRPRAVGNFTALLTGLGASMLVIGCNREAAPPADAGKADGTKTGAAVAGSGGPAPATPVAGTAPTTAKAGGPGAVDPAAKKMADAAKEKARRDAADQVPVETALVVRGPISAFLSFNSTLETESVVDIFPQTTGQVEALLVEEGRIVKEGDPLLKIEDRELRVDVEESTANFEHQKQNFARTEDLFKRNLVNKQEYDDGRYQLEQMRLRLERAKLKLAYTIVRAPFGGVISARETQVGARVGSGTKLFSMVKLDEIVARVFVPGRYLPVVAENQPAVVTSEYLPDRQFKGWVKRISPVIDPKSGTFKVTIGVRGEKPSDLPPGLFVGVRVITDTRPNAVLIPKRAVVYEGGERYVFIVEKNKAVKKKLAVGYEDPNNVEAVSGLDVGTTVIVLGQSGLKDGQLVRSVNPAPPALPGVPSLTAPAAKADPAAKTKSAVESAQNAKS
ncbi:MAG: efflux RND transporter periplasmic adaptor subunit [Verrucomicrobia bacterium]|nr:efflux RND transporter periplasmic adaptor subunit [Verrucomicrobiota bacterium]